MGIGLHPNAMWYACAGAFIGALVTFSGQNNHTSESDITSGLRLFTESQSPEKKSTSTAVSESLGLVPLSVTSTLALPLVSSELLVGSGDTLLGLLQKSGVTGSEAHKAVSALTDVYDPRDIRVGQRVYVSKKDAALDAMRISVSPGLDVMALRTDEDAFEGISLKAETQTLPQAYAGTISSSLYKAAIDQGVPAPVLADMIRLFSYDVDFQRDIRSNDHFEIMFGQDVTDEGLVVANSDIEYAAMTLRGETIKIYAFKHSEDETHYYNEEGKGIRKALMRTPINGARLSSSFGRRKHPVLGYTKMHRGVDFAAPNGTPIYAAGDGVIEKRQRWSSFGNYIRIRHGDGFSTAYAHMNNFAKGYSVGSRVRQGAVIGYVGTTGRSTGPHLHYEVLRNGAQVNPMEVRFPASKALSGEELKNFQRARVAADQKWLSLISSRDVASIEPNDVVLTLK